MAARFLLLLTVKKTQQRWKLCCLRGYFLEIAGGLFFYPKNLTPCHGLGSSLRAFPKGSALTRPPIPAISGAGTLSHLRGKIIKGNL